MRRLFAALLLLAPLSAGALNTSEDGVRLMADPVYAPLTRYQNIKKESLTREEFMAAMAYGGVQRIHVDRRGDAVMGILVTLVSHENPPGGNDLVRNIQAGATLPDFSLYTASGQRVDRAQLRGRTTLLSFASAICAPCRREAPLLNAFAARHPKLQIFSLTSDDALGSDQFIQASGLKVPQLVNARELFKTLGVRGFPSFVLVGPDLSVLAAGGVGFRDGKFGLEDWVRAALAGNRARVAVHP
ncbi:TlpA disulfide reductase family protein [Massilia sp. TS11]|uniref:TlpA family protein disulfide reductase n=1 Tax=Massilia sp. TS11 TaxID=2908003 RepID=UPI001EDB1FCA|nr:TlpA disulfide reductase family protein [Massilia sp. TS11]MCG2583153.1 TlpA family protein disulfide reductase [Massilia sp. TS11]